MTSRIWLLCALLCLAPPEFSAHFQYATVSYESLGGNTVLINVWSQFRRSFSSLSAFSGSGADGRAITGDTVDIIGVDYLNGGGSTQPVRVLTGDGSAYPLRMLVTQYSATEDFLFGYSNVTHTYAAPNDGGNDWLVTMEGCCRDVSGGGSFVVTARVNLAYESQSVAVKSLPRHVISSAPAVALV
eukprot:CAMPEP_0113709140 /NCGR_PEP_ID=MMETSP0038_2-20120614/29395_1 /TAXON_ID=2898 /ORGANISM="Cryptomonas paramecium" /LENGTH=185 /DNA_ID=CAMNT_0000634971 /DNA_START=1 /DNA_END=555 /DNA_ORIENTATION=+ /assembly_acc=CAM_ASM_000170